MDRRRTDAPKRNAADFIVTELDGEVLLYDTAAHRAHCLTRDAYRVLTGCDGRTTPATLAASLGLDRSAVAGALEALRQAGLVLPSRRGPDLSRRRAMKKLAVAAAVPLVWSIVAPSVAEAASTTVTCTVSPQGCNSMTVGQCCGTSGTGAGTCVLKSGRSDFQCVGGTPPCAGKTCS